MGSGKGIRSKIKYNVALIIPLEIVINFLLLVPFALAIYLSLTSWTPISGQWFEAPLTGGANYAEIVQFPRFQGAVANTLMITAGAVSLEFVIGLLLAWAFYSWAFRGKSVFSSIILIPMMIIPVITGFTFQTLFFQKGAINEVLSVITGTEVAIPWLNVTATALTAIIVADVWQWTPFMFLLLYAGMTALPSDPIRAARVLGASEMSIFRRIILPQLKPIITIALIIRSLETFKIFDIPFILTTGGNPGNTTETISIFLYKFGIEFSRIAFASAGALIIFIAIVLVTIRASRPLMPK